MVGGRDGSVSGEERRADEVVVEHAIGQGKPRRAAKEGGHYCPQGAGAQSRQPLQRLETQSGCAWRGRRAFGEVEGPGRPSITSQAWREPRGDCCPETTSTCSQLARDRDRVRVRVRDRPRATARVRVRVRLWWFSVGSWASERCGPTPV